MPVGSPTDALNEQPTVRKAGPLAGILGLETRPLVSADFVNEARSVVVVLHDINAAATWADRVVAMKDGRIHASGESAEILAPGVLGELYETRFDVLDHEGRPVVVSR